jgi:hypothetical protein
MSAVGSVFAAIFGVIWTVMATSMGAPTFFTLFGIIFVVFAMIQGIYYFNNTTNKNRMSVFDITDENEEPDPLQARMNIKDCNGNMDNIKINDANFCPYCGVRLNEEFSFCPKCGKKLKVNI